MSDQKKLFPEAEKEVDLVCNSLSLEWATTKMFEIISLVDAHCDKIRDVGSIRRLKPVVRDIDFLVISSDKEWKNLGKELELMLSAKLKMNGDQIKRFIVPTDKAMPIMSYVQADFYRTTTKTWGVYELIRTGSAEHNIWLAKYALKKGMQLKYSVGLINSVTKEVLASETEEEIFKALGFPYIVPEQREMKGGKPIWK